MIDDQLKALVRNYCGIDIDIIGVGSLHQMVRYRMTKTGVDSAAEYVALLLQSQSELQNLVNGLTIPETWFFRDEKPFDLLARWARDRWVATANNSLLRALSVPCASGEEPYSMAMALIDSGLTPAQFHIDALDINTHALALANRAIYEKKSFRSKRKHSLHHFQHREAGEFVLDHQVKQTVTFHHGDMLSSPLFGQGILYDVIFCRNLLIYFDKQTQQRASARLDAALAIDGLLFVGHAETNCVTGMTVEKKYHGTFCLKKKAANNGNLLEKRIRKNKAQLTADFKVKVKPDYLSKEASSSAAFPTVITLSAIERAYRAGQIIEAAGYCENFILHHPESAPAYFILASIRKASGNHQLAQSLFQKTVYLDPSHQQAMLELALISEQHGEKVMAMRWRARALRLRGRHA